MAIVSVDHVWSGETWDDDVTGPRGYQALYRVVSDDPLESPQSVRTAAGLPVLGDAFPTDVSAFVRRRKARRLDSTRLVWEVDIEYEFGLEALPENDPAIIRWTSSLERVPAIKDINGEAIVNSAGDYFDPPPEKDLPIWTISIQFNASSIPTAIISYAGSVNDGAITIDGMSVAAEQAKIVGLDIGERQERNDIEFRTITLSIAVADDGDSSLNWDLSLLDQGFRIKDGTDLKDILIEDEDGNKNRPSCPVLLDGNGAKLTDPSPSTAVFMDYEVTQKLDFTVFPGIS